MDCQDRLHCTYKNNINSTVLIHPLALTANISPNHKPTEIGRIKAVWSFHHISFVCVRMEGLVCYGSELCMHCPSVVMMVVPGGDHEYSSW